MSHCLESKTSNCKNCYKCIRHCPTKSIAFVNNKANIIHDTCILCGECYLVCPQQVKEVRNDIEEVKRLIASNKEVIVSLAPSFISNYQYSSLEEITDKLKKLGFAEVEETAIGATIVKQSYDEMLKEDRDVIISSCCHSVNLLIQKHYPEATPYLANVLSPMLAHGKDIKTRHPGARVVFIGPCIAKKDECDRNRDYVDLVLTFPELDAWLNEAGLEFAKKNENWKKEFSKARFFPTCGGVIKSMECKEKDYEYIAIDGVENCKRVLDDVVNGKIHKAFIEMSACSGSCVNGPMVNKDKGSVAASYLAINRSAGEKDFTDGKIAYKDIERNYRQIVFTEATPSEIDIEETLKKMGKEDKEKRLNCGSCGYDSCREKAIAIIQGKAVMEMCLPSLLEKAESFSDTIVSNMPLGIMVLDEELNIQLMNRAMTNILGVKDPKFLFHKSVTSILEPTEFYTALSGETVLRKKIYLSEYSKYVESSAIFDQNHHILVSIMKDITKEELHKQKQEEILKKSVDITDAVIEKNMRAVQEISSLLGESIAETKVALSSLKETLKDDE